MRPENRREEALTTTDVITAMVRRSSGEGGLQSGLQMLKQLKYGIFTNGQKIDD